VTEAEVVDIVETMERVREKYGGSITQGSVDNAATIFMNLAIDKYGVRNPGEPAILTGRDPSHCVDLLAKDSADVKCFKELYEEVKLVMAFLTDGKIKGLKNKLIEREA
jgi:hypothetical protein